MITVGPNQAIIPIEAVEEQAAPREWAPVAEFDGYALQAWESLPEAIRDALVVHSDGQGITWRLRTGRSMLSRGALVTRARPAMDAARLTGPIVWALRSAPTAGQRRQ